MITLKPLQKGQGSIFFCCALWLTHTKVLLKQALSAILSYFLCALGLIVWFVIGQCFPKHLLIEQLHAHHVRRSTFVS